MIIVKRILDRTKNKLKISQMVCLGYIAFQRPPFTSFYCTMSLEPILMQIVSISLCQIALKKSYYEDKPSIFFLSHLRYILHGLLIYPLKFVPQI